MRLSPIALLLLFTASGWAEQQDNLAVVCKRSSQQIEARHFQEASDELRAALKRYPSSIDLWNLLGIAESELNHPGPAKDAFEHGLKLAPDSPDLHENLGFLYYRASDYAAAKKFLSKAISLGSDKPGVAFSLAAARIRTGELEPGLADLQRLEPALGHVAEYWDERAWAETSHAPSQAETDFQRALAIDDADLRALNGLASLSESQKLDEKALSFLLRATGAHPGNVDTLVHLGLVCLRLDLTLDALEVLKHAHQLAPSNNRALYCYARAQVGVQHWQESYDLFSEYARSEPGFAPTYYALGWLDLKMNRVDEARKQFEHSLTLAPDYADPRYELAQLDLDGAQFDQAEKQLRKVLELVPSHARANVAFGDLMLHNGHLTVAQAHYQAAIASDPALGAAHYKLSIVLLRLLHSDEAEKERALALELNEKANRSSKTVLQLASPDGRLLNPTP